MVMHARKLPRIDDGYTDKRETQSYKSSQYPSKSSYSNHDSRYDRQQSPGRGSSPSSRNSPRYINKSSYIERNKEKYDRGNTGSPGKKVNHSYPSSSNHSNNGNPGHNSQQHTPSRQTNAQTVKDKSEVQKTAIRMCGDWSEHLSSSGNRRYYYNCKTEVSQWEKPREWSDSSASRTDRYSTDSRTSNDKHGAKEKSRHSSGSCIEKREKHLGDLRHMVVDGNPKPDKLFLLQKLQQSQSKMQAEMQANMSNKSMYSSDRDRRLDDHSPNDYPNSLGSSRRSRRDSDGARISRQTSRHDVDDLDSPGSTPTSHLSGSGPVLTPANISTANLNLSSIPGIITHLSGGQNNQDLTNQALQTLQKLQQVLSKQIASHQTSAGVMLTQSSHIQTSPRIPQPTSYTVDGTISSHHHHQQLLHHHQQPDTPHSQLHPAHRSPYTNSHSSHSHLHSTHSQQHPTHSSPQPIVTMATTSSSMSAVTTGSTTIPITHTGSPFPKVNTVYGKFLGSQNRTCTPNYSQLLEDKGGGLGHDGIIIDSHPVGSERSSCGSPAPSDTSSQGAPVDPDMFSTATGGHENNLMATLGQYYNDKLVGHVTGWQGELVERQSRLYGDESVKIGSLISSQVSVELKRARSLVRVEEIHATLHEQRNLFLAQQITELESMKPVSSVSSFLPSTSAS